MFSIATLLISATITYFSRNFPTTFVVIPNLWELMDSDEYYLQYNDVSIDHYVLFNGLQNTLDGLKRAETILMGSSRLGYAIQNDLIKGIKHEPYVMAFGHQEMDVFPMKIIEKFSLRPKLYVINIDQFFENKMSKFAEKVVKEGLFPAQRTIYEYNFSTLLQNTIHKYFPYFAPIFTQRKEMLLVRSRKNGSWVFLKEYTQEQDVRFSDEKNPSQSQITYGKSMVEKIKAHGSDVVFILIPNPDTSLKWGAEFSKALGVSFWDYSFDGVKFRDPSHITQSEGKKYTEFLIKRLNEYYSKDSN